MTYDLWQHQLYDVEKIRGEYKAGADSQLFVAPCGYGKTVLFCYITEQAYKKGKSILILTHRSNLVKQTSEELKENGLRHGIIASGYPSIRYRIQVASIQTLIRRLNQWESFDLIIADECHHFGAKTWQIIKNYFQEKNVKTKFFGCTATPLRSDNYGLGNDFDTMTVGHDYEYLIHNKFLSKPLYYVPGHINLDDIKKSMGDYNKKQLRERFKSDKYIISNALEVYSKKVEYKPALIYCINIEEAEKNEKEFKKAGYKALAIHSKKDFNIVDQGIQDLKKGKLHVLISCDMIGEGTNIKRVVAIIDERPTFSLAINHQHHGRGLRMYPGKEFSYHFDLVGNCEKHGLIHWPIKWKLTKEKFEPKIASVRTCEFCFAAYPAFRKKCPVCGMERIVRRRDDNIEQRAGELKKIDYKDLNGKIKKAKSLDELKKIGNKVKYNDGWAYLMWKQKQMRKETA